MMRAAHDAPRLYERREELRQLASAARAAHHGTGRLVAVTGEAGVGKTALVRALNSWVPAGARVLTGYCDALSTPRALGPFKDMAPALGREFQAAVHAGDREQVMHALLTALSSGPTSVLVIEDLHWADEGSLDVLRFLARRIGALRAVAVATFRDDEAGTSPLTAMAAGPSGLILPIKGLSAASVRSICEGSALDPDEVHRVTGGNPYLVGEMLGAGVSCTPDSVIGAVEQRLSRLPTAARELVEQLAVVPGVIEAALVARLVDGDWATLGRAEEAGLVRVRDGAVTFRHELTRLAVLGTVLGSRQVVLHQRVLALLREDEHVDAGRLVHHAVACGDVTTVVAEGPRAAREAATSGAHREAAQHLRTVLAHETQLKDEERAQLWEELGQELFRCGDGEAVTAAERAVELRRCDPDGEALVRCLCLLSRLAWVAGQPALAITSADEAVANAVESRVEVLQARALGNRSQLAMLHGHHRTAIETGREAVRRARSAGDRRAEAAALTNVGSSLMVIGPDGEAELLEAMTLAASTGDLETGCRAHINLAWNLIGRHRIDQAATVVADGMELAVTMEHTAYETHLTALASRLALAECRWDEALDLARTVPADNHTSKGVALVVEGLALARTGSSSPFDALHDAWLTAERADELQRRGPVAAAALEAALLSGVPAPITRALAVHREARALGDRRTEAELAYRLAALGHPRPDTELDALVRTGHPYAIQAAGLARDAADAWSELGRDFEQAVALSESDLRSDRFRALDTFHDLGAHALAQRLRRRLRESGEASVPSGPSARTRANPLGLTDRQAAVIELLATGLTNAEIAERLSLSRRTVDSHVSAILAKLGVATRRQAVAAYRK